MKYVITEDSNSGYKVWVAIAKCLNTSVIVKSSDGNKNLTKKLSDLPLARGDSVLVALDRVGFAIDSIMTSIINYCRTLGVKIEFTEYYCIEEVFVSYKNWNTRGFNLPTVADSCGLAFETINTYINNNKKYSPLKMRECQGFILSYRLRGKTKEHILAVLLQQYTRRSTYRVGRKTISNCWLVGCCPDSMDNSVKSLCAANSNININRHETLGAKIEDLCRNSILRKEMGKLL